MTDPRTILITGATAGIGLQSALQLAEQGHHLVLVGRNPTKLQLAADQVRAAGACEVDTHVGDFASLASVRALAAEVRAAHPRIDVLVNNAGAVTDKRRLTVDGFEETFAVNHLAGFLLIEELKDLVPDGGRIVLTASGAHHGATMDFDDLGYDDGWSTMKAYGRSKLANVLYTRTLAEELAARHVTVNCVHPGVIATDIWGGAPWYARPVMAVAKRFMQTPAKGGATLTRLATSPDVEGETGGYYDTTELAEPSDLARDDAVAARLREESARLVGLEASR